MKVTLGSDRYLRDVSGRIVGKALDKPGTFELKIGEGIEDGVEEDGAQLGLGLSSGSDGAVDVGLTSDVGRAREDRSEKLTAVNRVWESYCITMHPRSTLLGEQERKIIGAALKVASWEECIRAIMACERSDFHMARGEYQGGKRYNRLSQILKGKPASPRGPGKTIREQIDMFLDLAEKDGQESGVPSVGNDNIRRAKREVIDATEFPGDERIVERGQRARALLAEVGITVVDVVGGLPTFINS
jgi:hypothetical protein